MNALVFTDVGDVRAMGVRRYRLLGPATDGEGAAALLGAADAPTGGVARASTGGVRISSTRRSAVSLGGSSGTDGLRSTEWPH